MNSKRPEIEKNSYMTPGFGWNNYSIVTEPAPSTPNFEILHEECASGYSAHQFHDGKTMLFDFTKKGKISTRYIPEMEGEFILWDGIKVMFDMPLPGGRSIRRFSPETGTKFVAVRNEGDQISITAYPTAPDQPPLVMKFDPSNPQTIGTACSCGQCHNESMEAYLPARSQQFVIQILAGGIAAAHAK